MPPPPTGTPPGGTVPEHPDRPGLCHGWSWSRDARPRGPGLPPGEAGGEAALTAVGQVAPQLARGHGGQGWGEEAALSPTEGTAQAGPESPVWGERLARSSHQLQIKACCRLWEFFSGPPCSHDILLGAGSWVLCWTRHLWVRCLDAWLPPGQSFLKARPMPGDYLCVPST